MNGVGRVIRKVNVVCITKKNDFLEETLEHSWGKSPEQKAREKEYNAEYYRKNKDKWKKYLQEPGDLLKSWLHQRTVVDENRKQAKRSNELFQIHDRKANAIRKYRDKNSINANAQNEIDKALSRETTLAQLNYDANEKAIVAIGHAKAKFLNKLYSSTIVKDVINLFG